MINDITFLHVGQSPFNAFNNLQLTLDESSNGLGSEE